jgi:hypothetical protein
MPRISEVYAGHYVAAVELPVGRRITAVITSANAETVGTGDSANIRIVLELRHPDGRKWPKSLVLNKTNGTMIAAVYGDDTANWLNRAISVWREKVMFQSRLVDAIRMSAAAPELSAAAAAPPSAGNGPAPVIAMPGPVAAPPPPADQGPIPGAAPPLAQPRTVIFPDGRPVYDDIPGGPGGPGGPDDLDDAIPFITCDPAAEPHLKRRSVA